VPNLDGGIDTVGIIGIEERPIGYRKFGFAEAVSRGFHDTHTIVYLTAKFVKQLVFGEVSTKMLGGPLFIAHQSGKVAERGFLYLLQFMALLSVNLAVLNILPIPVLDGGHLVFLGIEAVKRSPLSMKARLMAQQVGMVVLLALIVFVTYNDILRFIGIH
jgi:regulator of sigma E protease